MRYYRVQQPRTLSHVLAWELDTQYSREAITYAAPGAGEKLEIDVGVALGRRSIGAVTSAKTGTGNGTRTGVSAGVLAQVGDYVVTQYDAAADLWSVVAPDGTRLADAKTGVAYASPHIAFTINEGGTAWVAGDIVTFSVAAGSGEYAPLDPEAVDGSQHFDGVSGAVVVVEGTTAQKSFAVVRGAALVADAVIWPDGFTDGQKAAALASVRDRGLVAR